MHGLGKPLGYQQLTPTVATALTVPTGARIALINCDTQNARWRDDGTDPTSSVGMLMRTTDPVLVYDGNLSAFTIIEATSGSKVSVSYYK